jgi:formate dehydrogenase major subunit
VVISGDEAALDPSVRALAERANAVIGIGMFEGSFRGLADLVLPGTSYLERDGTTVNLESRLQRQRRAVIAPCPDELAWIAKLAGRFGVDLSPHASVVFEEVSAICYGGISFGDVGEQAALPAPSRAPTPSKRRRRPVAGARAPPPDVQQPRFSGGRPSSGHPSSTSSGATARVEELPR